MKIINRYFKGLYELLEDIGNPDPDIGVAGIIMLFEAILLVNISIIFNFRIPLSEEFGNKWLVRVLGGIILVLFNLYVLGIRESRYGKYEPLSKSITLLITVLFFVLTLGFLLYSSSVNN